MSRIRVLAAITFGSEGVERDGAGAPIAFRIWRPGVNATDHGAHVFSEASARRLMVEQSTRGNLISIDVDHLSLNEKAPPESRKAVGWLRLETRITSAGPELWATNVQWTDAVRAGLTKDPPEWRYFSPAYDVEKDSGEIVSFLNLALTNNPATHHVTALSTRRIAASREAMKVEDIIAAMYGADEEKKKEAKAAIAAMSDEDRAKCKEAMAAGITAAFGEEEPEAGESEDEKKKKEEAARASAAEDEKKKQEEAARVAAARSADQTVLASLGTQDQRIKALEATNEQAARERIMATRPDLTESQKKFLASKPLAEVEGLLASLLPPTVTAANAAAQPSVRPVQGQRGAGVRAARLPADQNKELAAKFGRNGGSREPYWEGNDFVLPVMSPATAKKVLERHAKDYGSDATVPMRSNRGDLIGTIGNFNMREFDNAMASTLKGAQVQS